MCHRTLLVCRALTLRATQAQDGGDGPEEWAIRHIVAEGRIETRGEAEARMLSQVGVVPDLLRDRDQAVADAYRQRGRKIAWRKS
jgi:hypothetical protein